MSAYQEPGVPCEQELNDALVDRLIFGAVVAVMAFYTDIVFLALSLHKNWPFVRSFTIIGAVVLGTVLGLAVIWLSRELRKEHGPATVSEHETLHSEPHPQG